MSATSPTLAISTGPLWRLPTERAFEVVKSAGADGVEVLVTQQEDTQSPRVLESLAQRFDLPIVAVHAPQLLVTRRAFSTDQVKKVHRTAELARAVGAETVVLHPPYAWHLRYASWVSDELAGASPPGGPLITMENMYPVHFGRRRVRFHRFGTIKGLRRFDHVTLDTSHLAVAEQDIVSAYRALADRVVHVHLSDNRGKGRDSHAPLGDGVLPVIEFLRALDGPSLRSIALEIDPGPKGHDPDHTVGVFGASLELVRRHLAVRA